jgi:hypothetical protein
MQAVVTFVGYVIMETLRLDPLAVAVLSNYDSCFPMRVSRIANEGYSVADLGVSGKDVHQKCHRGNEKGTAEVES